MTRSAELWTIAAPLRHEDGALAASLPAEPRAGRIAYYLDLRRGADTVRLPATGDAMVAARAALRAGG